jgi:hypothetical protein
MGNRKDLPSGTAKCCNFACKSILNAHTLPIVEQAPMEEYVYLPTDNTSSAERDHRQSGTIETQKAETNPFPSKRMVNNEIVDVSRPEEVAQELTLAILWLAFYLVLVYSYCVYSNTLDCRSKPLRFRHSPGGVQCPKP